MRYKLFGLLTKRASVWIAAILIVANLYAWTNALLAAPAPHVVAAIRDPEIVTLLEYIQSGGHSGETWQVTLQSWKRSRRSRGICSAIRKSRSRIRR